MNTPDSLTQLLDDLADYLAYHKEQGVTSIDVGETPAPPPAVTIEEGLAAIAQRVAACTRCGLCEKRTHTVPGQGSPTPEILFIGEGPGAEEDRQGLAFVGPAGELLTKMITAMGFSRDQVFIGNIVKCRPPGNRNPEPDEMAACMPYLLEQIALLKPRVIVALGATALKGLTGNPRISITRTRGTWLTFEGIDLMPTFHPAYLLRTPAAKKEVWDDLQEVLVTLGRTPPAKE
jgi:DNA polymerase